MGMQPPNLYVIVAQGIKVYGKEISPEAWNNAITYVQNVIDFDNPEIYPSQLNMGESVAALYILSQLYRGMRDMTTSALR